MFMFFDVHVFFILGLLFDSGFDVIAGFVSWFKKNIEEQALIFLDLNHFVFNFIYLIN